METSVQVFAKDDKLSFDEAARQLRDLEHEVAGFEFSALLLKFRQGRVVARTERVHGEDTLSKLADATYSAYTGKVSVSTLRSCEKVFNHFASQSDDPEAAFKSWLKEHPDARVWYALDNLARGTKLPSQYDEDDVQKLVGRVEKVGRDFERINELVASEKLSEEEAEGVRERIFTELQTLQENFGFERQVPRSDDFKKFVRQFPCPITGDYEPDFHHIGTGGMAQKASDFGGVPLAHALHMEYHTVGRVAFEEKHGVNMHRLALNYVHRFLTGQWFDMNLPLP